MILTIHSLAKTYKVLPTEALERATTFDLYVLDVYTQYLKYQEQRSQQPTPASKELTVEDMLEMRRRVLEAEAQGA